jgi:hypothetical protein
MGTVFGLVYLAVVLIVFFLRPRRDEEGWTVAIGPLSGPRRVRLTTRRADPGCTSRRASNSDDPIVMVSGDPVGEGFDRSTQLALWCHAPALCS